MSMFCNRTDIRCHVLIFVHNSYSIICWFGPTCLLSLTSSISDEMISLCKVLHFFNQWICTNKSNDPKKTFTCSDGECKFSPRSPGSSGVIRSKTLCERTGTVPVQPGTSVGCWRYTIQVYKQNVFLLLVLLTFCPPFAVLERAGGCYLHWWVNKIVTVLRSVPHGYVSSRIHRAAMC